MEEKKEIMLRLDKSLYNELKKEATKKDLVFSKYLKQILENRNKTFMSEFQLKRFFENSKDYNKLAVDLKSLNVDLKVFEDIFEKHKFENEDDFRKELKFIYNFIRMNNFTKQIE